MTDLTIVTIHEARPDTIAGQPAVTLLVTDDAGASATVRVPLAISHQLTSFLLGARAAPTHPVARLTLELQPVPIEHCAVRMEAATGHVVLSVDGLGGPASFRMTRRQAAALRRALPRPEGK